jgi:cytochrome c-type biogenesis protein
MNQLPLAYAFGAGLLATLNPCGFALLPSFVAFYLGTQATEFEQMPLLHRVGRAIGVGSLVTAGFLTVFLFFGFLFNLGLRFFFAWVPYLTLVIATGLIVLGIFMLLGKTISIHLPQPSWAVRQKGKLPMYLYGVTYAVASLSCTLPVFLIVVGTAAAQPGPLASLTMFMVYGAGMATILVGVTIGAAFFQGVVGSWLRAFIPYVHRVSAILLITMGLYLVSLELGNTTGLNLNLWLGENSGVTNFLSENSFWLFVFIGLLAATFFFLISRRHKRNKPLVKTNAGQTLLREGKSTETGSEKEPL